MTPPNTEATQAPQSDKVAQLEGIVTKQAEKVDAVTNQLAELTKAVNASLSRTVTKEVPKEDLTDPLWKEFDPDFKKAVETTVEVRTKSLKDEMLGTLQSESAREKQKDTYDKQALKEFPQLLDEKSEFRNEYNRLLAQKQAEDSGYSEKPSAVYETAMLAFGSLVRKGKIVPKEFNDEARRLISIGDSQGLGMYPGSSQNSDDLTDSQAFWAKKLKVSKENYLKQLRGK